MNTFPLIEISGTHSDIGRAIGETFRTKIQSVIQDKKNCIEEYSTILPHIEPFIALTKKTFPQYIDELQAVADAASVRFEDLFFRNIGALTDPETSLSREEAETIDHCTSVVSWQSAGHPIVGHNEDWDQKSLDELYILKATIGSMSFISLNYATFLPGVAVGMNSFGLVQCINEIPQTRINGIPKNFIARAILESPSLDTCERIIRSTKHASGYNHVLLQGNMGRDVEMSGATIDIQSFDYMPYAHTNHFLSKQLERFEINAEEHHKNSYARLSRVHELITLPMDKKDIEGLLSDHYDKKYPICRHGNTIASIIIEPAEHTFWVCYGLPCQGTYIPYTL